MIYNVLVSVWRSSGGTQTQFVHWYNGLDSLAWLCDQKRMKDPTRNFWEALSKTRFLAQILVVESQSRCGSCTWKSLSPKARLHSLPCCSFFFFPYMSTLLGVVRILLILWSVWSWQPPEGRYSLSTEKNERKIPTGRKDRKVSVEASQGEKK